jgi:hypothetical protein
MGAVTSVIGGAVLGKLFGLIPGKLITGSQVRKIFGGILKVAQKAIDLIASDRIGDAVLQLASALASMLLPPFPNSQSRKNV